MNRDRAPLIAVTSRPVPKAQIEGYRENVMACSRAYIDAVQRAGGLEAVQLPVPLTDEQAAERLTRFDGLVLIGGGDLDPARYGQEPHAEVYGTSADSDAFELALARAAIATGTPTLAICRGHQVLNVALGGTLVQHVPDVEGTIEHRRGVLHEVSVESGSRVAKALRTHRPMCLSWHHQAVDRVGEGLVVTARADDGIVEALEHEGDAWIVAVQWHPEDTAATDPVQQRLFDAFVAEAAATADRPGR